MSNKAQYVRQIPVSQIVAGSNDRKEFSTTKLAELAESIRQHGLAQPITVRPIGKDQYQIVAGERRYRAVCSLGWERIAAMVRELTDEEAAAIMLVENTSRVDLDPVAEARAYAVRAEKFGWSATKIAETAGVSAARVGERLKLLVLCEDVLDLVRIGHFPIGHAMMLGDLDKNRQRIAVRVYASSKFMPLDRWREIVQQLVQQQASENQIGLFDMEFELMSQVAQDDVPALKGKRAVTGAPTAKHLPKPRTTRAPEAVGNMLERYIQDLQRAGLDSEASVVGTIYNAMVAGNWASVPVGSVLAKSGDTTAVGNDSYTLIG